MDSLIGPYRNATSKKQATVNAAVGLVAITGPAWIGWVSMPSKSDPASLLLAAVIFAALGLFMMAVGGSYNRFSQACLFVIAGLALTASFSLAGSGIVKFALPHSSFMSIWGIEVLLAAILVAIRGFYLHLLIRSLEKKKPTPANEIQARKSYAAREKVIFTALAMGCSGLMLFLAGLLT